MKILLVDSGNTSSTADVFHGYRDAFLRAGHDVTIYQLSARIGQANYALDHAWKRLGKPADHRPTGADVYYRASEGILAFALRHQPDLVLVVTAQFVHPDIYVFLRRAGFCVGLLTTEGPYGNQFEAHYLQAANLGWTQERTSVQRLRERSENPNVHYLPAAYDPTIHRPEPLTDEATVLAHDVVLVATAFRERVEFLQSVDWTGIDLGLYGDWRTLRKGSKLIPFVKGGLIDNRSAAALYRKAKIGLNVYRDGLILAGKPGGVLTYQDAESVPAESLNPRAYELAACGCFQISQPRQEVDDIFGASVPQVTEPAELTDIIREMLAKPERRRQWAEQSRYAVLGHSFDARMGTIIEHVTDLDRTQLALARPDQGVSHAL